MFLRKGMAVKFRACQSQEGLGFWVSDLGNSGFRVWSLGSAACDLGFRTRAGGSTQTACSLYPTMPLHAGKRVHRM